MKEETQTIVDTCIPNTMPTLDDEVWIHVHDVDPPKWIYNGIYQACSIPNIMMSMELFHHFIANFDV
jgi:hypothetical protein